MIKNLDCNYKLDDKFYVVVYLGDSADEELFHIRGIGDEKFLKKQLSTPPTEAELVGNDRDEEYDEENELEIICGEDIWGCLPENNFDYLVKIYHSDRKYYVFKNDDQGNFPICNQF